MEVKKITETEFENTKGNRGYRNIVQEGNLNGDYNDFLSFLKWTLESNHNNNAGNLKESIQFFADRYGMSMTKQFLMSQMRSSFPSKTKRIMYLLDKIGITTTPINRYFYSVINAKMKLREFGTERSYNVGHTYNKLNKEGMDLLIDKKQHEQRLAEMKLNFEEMAKKKKKPINPPEEPKPEHIDEPGIEVKCKRCNGIIKVPLTPNFETDKDERLVAGIYSCFISGIENGVRFCNKCEMKMEQEGLWKSEVITNWLQENKGSCIEVSMEEFCNEFRNDKKNVSGTAIKQKIESLMPVECRLTKDNIKISIQ